MKKIKNFIITSRKLLLEGILFFLIGLCTIDVAVASYVKMNVQSINTTQIIKKVKQIKPVENTIIREVYSNVLFVKNNEKGTVVAYQSFSQKEFDLITQLAQKINQEDFMRFMDSCFTMEKDKFMKSAKSMLNSSDDMAKKPGETQCRISSN